MTYIPPEIYGTMGNLLASGFPITAINQQRSKIQMERESVRKKTERKREEREYIYIYRERERETEDTQ